MKEETFVVIVRADALGNSYVVTKKNDKVYYSHELSKARHFKDEVDAKSVMSKLGEGYFSIRTITHYTAE